MVELTPTIRKITPFWWELQWKEEPSDLLLHKRLTTSKWIRDHFEEDLLEIRHGYQSLSLIWKCPPPSEFQLSIPTNIPFKREAESIWKIPVCYGGKFGKDLEMLCEEKGVSEKDFIELYSKSIYRLEFYGFLPGFMYLSGLPHSLSFPRKQFPDRKVEAGSVGIGGNQTGIYPIESPGGWHLIGKTPISIFSPFDIPPVKPQVGDQIIFEPISEEEFEQLIKEGSYLKQV